MESFARWNNEAYLADDLECYCAIASYFLVMVGRRLGYNLALVEGVAFDEDVDALQNGEEPQCYGEDASNHCWVEYNGEIIDLTAKQFNRGLKKVHIVDDDDENYWRLHRHNAARKRLKVEWSDEQTPYSFLPELRRRADVLKTKLAA